MPWKHSGDSTVHLITFLLKLKIFRQRGKLNVTTHASTKSHNTITRQQTSKNWKRGKENTILLELCFCDGFQTLTSLGKIAITLDPIETVHMYTPSDWLQEHNSYMQADKAIYFGFAHLPMYSRPAPAFSSQIPISFFMSIPDIYEFAKVCNSTVWGA